MATTAQATGTRTDPVGGTPRWATPVAPARVRPGGWARLTRVVLAGAVAFAGLAAAAPPADAAIIDPNMSGTTFSALAVDASGATIHSLNPTTGLAPASVTKTLTALAAARVLPPTATFRTQVWSSGAQLVLQGGGDAAMRSADYVALGTRTATALKLKKITKVSLYYDTRLFVFDQPAPAGWQSDYYGVEVAKPSALSVIGSYSTRPHAVAQSYLAQGLRAAGITVTIGYSRTAAGTVVASASHTLRDIVRRVLVYSDNTAAEVLGRHVARLTAKPTTFAGAVQAVQQRVREAGVNLTGAVTYDTSGLSRSNRLSATHIVGVLNAITTAPTTTWLRDPTMWAVAGQTGTLTSPRFSGYSACAVGKVFGKTGTLSGVVGLAGWTKEATTGTWRAFAVLANGATMPRDPARAMLDRYAARVNGCLL
jgi:D-alanyl-D-alanine carboxypeptidase/D-alanyl-D-alanine-endopeptidase (penicillin-binding protein 4)